MSWGGFPVWSVFPMKLTNEQMQAVSGWVAAGDGLSAIQKKLAEHFKISMTFMDVRFLVDDLNLALKDPAPKANPSDVGKPAAPAAAPGAPHADAPGEPSADEAPPEEDAVPLGAGAVSVSVDKVTLIPGAMASGAVTFSDGVTAKWIIDNQGRPGLTEVSKEGYRPSPDDAQAFMQELSAALQSRGY